MTTKMFKCRCLLIICLLLLGNGCYGSSKGKKLTIDLRNGKDSIETADYKISVSFDSLLTHFDVCDRPPSLIGIYYPGSINVENLGSKGMLVSAYSFQFFKDSGALCFSREKLTEVNGELEEEYITSLPVTIQAGETFSFNFEEMYDYDMAYDIRDGCFSDATGCGDVNLLQKIVINMKYGQENLQVFILLDKTDCWLDGDRCMFEPLPEDQETVEEFTIESLEAEDLSTAVDSIEEGVPDAEPDASQ